MRPSHASSKYLTEAPPISTKSVRKEKWEKGLIVKGRNEPFAITRVAYAIAKIKDIPVEQLAEA